VSFTGAVTSALCGSPSSLCSAFEQGPSGLVAAALSKLAVARPVWRYPPAARGGALTDRTTAPPAASPGRRHAYWPVGGCGLPVKIFSIQLRRLICKGLSRLPRRDWWPELSVAAA
jgi:hypothetical protein